MINFMVTHARGLICVPMMAQRLRQLQIPMMVQDNTARLSTAFTVSVDALNGTTTGISAQDRSTTVQALIDPETRPEDLGRPGHIFPLRYAEGGVLVRAGHTEATVDLPRMAGMYPAGVLCEIMGEDGSMARMPELEALSAENDIGIVTIADIIAYRRGHEKLVERVAEARIPTDYGTFEAISYRSIVDKDEHVALVMGGRFPRRAYSRAGPQRVPDQRRLRQHPVRLWQPARHGASGHSPRRQGRLCLYAPGRPWHWHTQQAQGVPSLQDDGLDTVDANVSLGFASDIRHYGVGVQILEDLGVGKMRILTNNPRKLAGLSGFGSVEVVERVPIIAPVNKENSKYLETKRKRMGHLLDSDASSGNAG